MFPLHHADKAASIPNRLYSLLESNIDLEQFLRSIHRYVQLGVHIKGYYSPERQKFHREISEVVEFYVTEDNEAKTNTLYKKTPDGKVTIHNPTKYLLGYLESQGLIMQPDILVKEEFKPVDDKENYVVDNSTMNQVIKKTNSVPINQVKPQPIINNQARPQPVMNNPKPPVINQPVNNNSPNRFIQANNVAVNQQNNPINNQVPKPNGTNIVQNNQ